MDATMRRRARLVRGLAAVSLIAMLASGCQMGLGEPSGGDGDGKGTGQSQQEGEDQKSQDQKGGGSDAGGADGAVVDDDTAAAGVDVTAIGEPIATATVPATVEGDKSATITVNLHSLERQGSVLMATYTFKVNASTSGSTETEWLYTYLGDHSWDTYLIDKKNLNRHGVMSNASGTTRAATAYQGAEFAPGETFYAYAMFAAPPADVTEMDVQLIEGAPLAVGVKIK